MHVVVLASQKGGAGKTTLALHLAVAAEAAGFGPAVLIDTDAQGTLTKWWHARTIASPKLAAGDVGCIGATLKEMRQAGFALAVIDTAGRANQANSAILEHADLVVLPVKPSAADLWALGVTLDDTKALKRPFVFVLSQAVRGASVTVQALALLAQHGPIAPVVIHHRVGYAAAMGLGETIQELEGRGRGAAEVAELWSFMQSRLTESTQSDLMDCKQTRKRARIRRITSVEAIGHG